MKPKKKPLFRKVNTRARNVHHGFGGDFRDRRNKTKNDEATVEGMGGSKQRGLDYTPLFRFLLSKVGQDWGQVYGEAVSRLNNDEPIFWMVIRSTEEAQLERVRYAHTKITSHYGPADYLRSGESTYFSRLFVDDNNRLQKVNPSLTVDLMEPDCACCTHTFNGKPFTKKFDRDD